MPGIPNFVDYNYKSATLMLMSLSREAALGPGELASRVCISRSPIRPRYATPGVTSRGLEISRDAREAL